jgi:hypothetical protein
MVESSKRSLDLAMAGTPSVRSRSPGDSRNYDRQSAGAERREQVRGETRRKEREGSAGLVNNLRRFA